MGSLGEKDRLAKFRRPPIEIWVRKNDARISPRGPMAHGANLGPPTKPESTFKKQENGEKLVGTTTAYETKKVAKVDDGPICSEIGLQE